MTTRKNSYFSKPLIVLAIGFATALAVGCGDDDSGETTPNGGTKANGGDAGAGNKAGSGGNAGTSSKAGSSSMGGAETMGGGGAGPEPMGGEAGMGGAPDCTDETDMGCYSCAPKTLVQWLNHCPTTGCEPFDNTALGSLKDNKLPDLP